MCHTLSIVRLTIQLWLLRPNTYQLLPVIILGNGCIPDDHALALGAFVLGDFPPI